MSKLDSRTEEEKQADAEHECMVREATRSWTLRRADLESRLAEELGDAMYISAREVRRAIAECDRALMELAAGRLPRR